MRDGMAMPRTLKHLLCAGLIAFISGCSTLPVEVAFAPDPNVVAVWPSPPETSRIKLLRIIRGPADVLPKKGGVTDFLGYVLGENSVLVDLITPQGVVADGKGVMYIADPGAGVVHRYDLVRQTVGYLRDAGDEIMVNPVCVALDLAGNVYVSDTVKAKVYKFSSKGHFLGELAGGAHTFLRPAGIAVTPNGDVVVADALAHKLKVFNGDGLFLREFPNPEGKYPLKTPSYVATDREGLIYVTDSMNFRIQVYDILGNFRATIGEIGDSPGSFGRPKGVGVDSEQHVYVVDGTFDNFQIFGSGGELLLHLGKSGSGKGEFSIPGGMYIDFNDRIYVADTFNRRIQIFQYLKEGATR